MRRMRWARLVTLAVVVAGCGGASTALEETGDAASTLEALSDAAIEPGGAEAIAALRAAGREGHRALFARHADAIARLRAGETGEAAERLRHAIDVVSAQRDGFASGLYWHTELEAALDEARATGRPVLSLRLLGRLDEELSCANSRYFRTVLYADARVARALEERFVLHWSSERPVPRVTIDMGDGRTFERTLTGNSIHYVLDSSGRVIDGLPGLYGPERFVRVLDAAHGAWARCAGDEACLRGYHQGELYAREGEWETIRRTTSAPLPSWTALSARTVVVDPDAPSAVLAMPLTVSKLAVELPLLDALQRRPPPRVEDVPWQSLAPLEALDAASLALIDRKSAGRADELAPTLAHTASADGLRNELELHPVLHRWLAADGERALAAVNARVYRDLFLTPASDPWLGLRAPELWDAIETIE